MRNSLKLLKLSLQFERKILVALVAILLLAAGLPLGWFASAAVSSSAVVERFVRTPSEVYSGQAVLVFAKVVGELERVELDVTIRVEASAGMLSKTFERDYVIRMLPTPWAPSWYFTAIPGLPTITQKPTLKISSAVEYKLLVDGVPVTSERYAVLEGKAGRRLPPIVLAVVYDVLRDEKLVGETLGLGPRGWVVAPATPQRALVVALDDSGFADVGSLSFEYSVSSGPWQRLPLTEEPLSSAYLGFINDLNEFLRSVEEIANVNLPKIMPSLLVAYADIPGQSPGNYVMFHASAIDADGSNSTSSAGFYYVVSKGSDIRILIVDPHVKLWVLQEGVKNFIQMLKQNVDYELPDEVVAGMRHAVEVANAVASYGVVPFHHWELLGKYYNLYIAWPDEGVTNLLKDQAEGGFEPHVIILSNLWLGYGKAGDPWNWDLRDAGILDNLISYTKKKHAGLIATHGTLSDWVVWAGCEKKQHIKVGTRGHIGSNISDANSVDEKTVAALLGMPHLALWEFVRDEIAYTLCRSEHQQYGILVGSIPLQISYIPFNGTLRVTKEGEGHEVLSGLPTEFEVLIPSIYKEFGFKAYTQVGWQLAFPSATAYAAWWKAKEVRPAAEKILGKLATLVENATRNAVPRRNISYTLGSLEWGLRSFYRSLVSANITAASFNTSLYIPALGRNVSISLNATMLRNLLQLLPAKLIAESPDALAGIVIYDKYWDREGYRAVYFSPELEASNSSVTEKLFKNAVEWVMKWEYRNITELLRSLIRVPKDVAVKFEEVASKLPGKDVFSNSTLLVEEGLFTFSSEVRAPGSLHILIVHPTTDEVKVVVLRGSADNPVVEKVAEHLTKVTISVGKPGVVEVGIRACTDASLNPAYVLARYEVVAPQYTIKFYVRDSEGNRVVGATLIFNGVEYSDGSNVTKPSGTYPLSVGVVPSGYEFSYWSVTGAVSVKDPSANSTEVVISGDGSVTMVLKAVKKEAEVTSTTATTNTTASSVKKEAEVTFPSFLPYVIVALIVVALLVFAFIRRR